MSMKGLQKCFLILAILCAVGIYLQILMKGRRTIPSSPEQQSSELVSYTGPEQTNNTSDFHQSIFKYYLNATLNGKCNAEYRRTHHLLIDIQPGCTSDALFQIYCGLVLGIQMCYRVIVEKQNTFFIRYIATIFSAKVIFQDDDLDKQTFHRFRAAVVNEGSGSVISMLGKNRTLSQHCRNNILTGYVDYIRSSVQFQDYITKLVIDFIGLLPSNRSLVVIHVRRKDTYANLEWYKPYIDRAMNYLTTRYKTLSFIFVTDDKQWCQENFHGDNIHFSPFSSDGLDLAFMKVCDHVIMTTGTLGWHGAWLSQAKTVIYHSKCVWEGLDKRMFFFLPNWIDLGKPLECQ